MNSSSIIAFPFLIVFLIYSGFNGSKFSLKDAQAILKASAKSSTNSS